MTSLAFSVLLMREKVKRKLVAQQAGHRLRVTPKLDEDDIEYQIYAQFQAVVVALDSKLTAQ
jgi:hypothetical protein